MLNEKQKNYLISQIGYHITDLLPKRQTEFKAHPATFEWKLAALSEGALEDWNKWGFRLWGKTDFAKRVEEKLKTISEMTDEELFPKPAITQSFSTFGIPKIIDVITLATYPRKAWDWIDDNTIKSNVVKSIFTVVGGKETYEKFIRGELDIKVPEVGYYYDGNMYQIKGANRKPTPVLSIAWHRTTSWTHIDEVKEGAPEIYAAWSAAGLIPKEHIIKTKKDWDLE